jgi:hypothetical protein
MRRLAMLASLGISSACGGPAPASSGAEAPQSSASDLTAAESDDQKASGPGAAEAEAEAEAAPTAGIPSACAKSKDDLCVPGSKFVDKLCGDFYPGTALFLFQSSSPWVRGYLTRKTKAWNASGGVSEEAELEFDEEVIILRKRSASSSGIQVSGAGGGWDAIRWDGTCVTLAAEELTKKRPPSAKYAKVDWKQLDSKVRDSLLENEAVTSAYRERRNECKGASMGTVSLKCVKADQKLSRAIVDYVRGGGSVATPQRLPGQAR